MTCAVDRSLANIHSGGSLHFYRTILVALFLVLLTISSTQADEARARYFEQLRQRGLFSLAESEAISRLAADNLTMAARSDESIELSRTLTDHAGYVSDEQRNELWLRARTTIEDVLKLDRANPRSVLLNGQLASVYVAEGDWLRAEREIRPFDEPLLNQARAASTKAIEHLKSVEGVLAEPGRDPNLKRPAPGVPLSYELRALLHRVRLQLGQSYRNRAELSPAGSPERIRDLSEAEQSVRRLVGAADEPVQTRAKLLLVTCLRLRNELDKAFESLSAIEAVEPKPIDVVQDEIIAERARLLIEKKLPTEAAQLLLKTRGKRQRLSGEMWLLQVRSLIALRDFSLSKNQESLADRIHEQIVTTIARSEEQVGGYWSRRCRTLWDNAQTAQKYGAELDAQMQHARNDFTAGRIEAALTGYSAAEKSAAQKGQSELAMELGFTRASILLDGMRFEEAAAEFLRLAAQFSTQPRAAKSHLLGTYCLGRLYDEKKSQARRQAYTDALDRHLSDYSTDPTINDARFMKAQLEEQRLQATLALPLYLQVEANHTRALEAMAGAARCYETILHRMNEKRLSTNELEREAVIRLTAYLSLMGESSETWKATHAEIAIRLAAILLMGSSSQEAGIDSKRATDDQSAKEPDPAYAARSKQATRWLNRVASFTERKDPEGPAADVIERLRRRVAPLQILALAGTGKTAEAERILASVSASPGDLLNVLDRLTRFVTMTRGEQRARIASLQLQVAERLAQRRDELSLADRELLDRCQLNAYVTMGRIAKAVEFGTQLAEQSAKDSDKQREMATLFADVFNPDAQSLAKQCWRRVESATKAGSAEWMSARLGILKASIRLNQFDEARKLLQVTKVLYPDLGGEPLKNQFDAIELDLKAAKPGK